MWISHLGVKVKDKPTNHINKESYLTAKPEGMPGWDEDDFARQIPRAAYNYDLNMRFFETLDPKEFSLYVKKKVKKYKMKECSDLNEISGISGMYMMVLDEYKQVYIGVSGDMKRRIMQHWSKNMSLERLVCGYVFTSVLSINSFGALDTTRVFYNPSSEYGIYGLEEKVLNDFETRFTLNRTAGGIGSADTYTDGAAFVGVAIAAGLRDRDLERFVTLEALREAGFKKDISFYFRKHPELE